MIIEKNTLDFNKRVDVVSCFIIEPTGKALFLQRQTNKSSGGKWGPPAGKVEDGESLEEAALREVFEESGIQLTTDRLKYLGSEFVRHSDFDFEYHIFLAHIDTYPDIALSSSEHESFAWATYEESFNLDLVEDQSLIHEKYWSAS